MAAVSRIRDPQRLVELVADTMYRERNRSHPREPRNDDTVSASHSEPQSAGRPEPSPCR